MVRKATPGRWGLKPWWAGVQRRCWYDAVKKASIQQWTLKTSGWASKRTRKTQRDGHNSGVKIWSLSSVSSTLSHANLEQPFRTLAIKWEVNLFVKKSSCILILLASSFLRLYHVSFITVSVIIASVCIQYIYVYFCMNQKMTIQHRHLKRSKYTTVILQIKIKSFMHFKMTM